MTPRRFVRTTRREGKAPLPDLVGQDFSPGVPNRRYVSDISYIRTSEDLATSLRCWTFALAGSWAGHYRAGCPMSSSSRRSRKPLVPEAAWLVRSCTATGVASTCPAGSASSLRPSGAPVGWDGGHLLRQRCCRGVLLDAEA